ncbi:methyltransferase [Halobacillus andaensis]|uniref:Methyltransferase n=1 Tax=Halobacillus andaensis TaxID=1176239 RepID=A0A917B051_HALAA|nr:class I SAM-dependent methyltransferase [Halobacillus andaensis]MBP2003776.1 ubiquinone/menaquinone biosynthesis C-methylase UbiE [Halobacillus andaensis]GGF13175.1 methyltransferase [Halobacillus andaensis]
MTMTHHNRLAWNKKVKDQAAYTKPVSEDIVEKAKRGDWQITMTTTKMVPREWFPASLEGVKVLCLASGGGQQGPILAAAGADVVVVDISEGQLEQDKYVANRDRLSIETIQGDMTDLHFLENETFDLIVHPVSNLFVENILPVWKEAFRVLKPKGTLISGFTNPLLFIFDEEEELKGNLVVKHSVPSSSLTGLTDKEVETYLKSQDTVEFAHTLEDQIQGQMDAGFVIAGFYEDYFGGNRPLDRFINTFMVTKAVKLKDN